MAKEKSECCEKAVVVKDRRGSGGMFGGVYGLAFIGAAVYFIQQATTFWMGVLGFLKAIVWPALLIYKVFTMIKM